jgi:hypothetical protein
MNTESIIQIVSAAAASTGQLVTQLAWFFSIQAAAGWLSISLPLLIIFGVLMKAAATLKAQDSNNHMAVGKLIIIAWIVFAGTIFTGVRGMAHVVQAAFAPTIYVMSEVGQIGEAIKSVKGVGK